MTFPLWNNETRARAIAGVIWPHESLDCANKIPTNGSTEPWTAQLAAIILSTIGARDVLELGVFMGRTSAMLCLALARMGGGTFTGFDVSGGVGATAALLETLPLTNVTVKLVKEASPACLEKLPEHSIDFVWVDDNHTKPHVIEELKALRRVVRPEGIICGHDAYGKWDLQEVFKEAGGYALNLPSLGGNSGGIGILQVGDLNKAL